MKEFRYRSFIIYIYFDAWTVELHLYVKEHSSCVLNVIRIKHLRDIINLKNLRPLYCSEMSSLEETDIASGNEVLITCQIR